MSAMWILLIPAALVWGAVVLVRGGLLAGCLAVLLAGVCFGHPFFHAPLGPLPLTADRLLWAVLIVQYAIWRRWGRTEPTPLDKADVVALALVGLLAASTLAHDWQAHQAQPLSRLVLLYAMPLGLYWVARGAVLTERAVLAVLGFLAILGLYLAATALAETHQLGWLVYPKYVASPEYPEFLGRGRGPLLNPVGCGLFQGVGMVSLLMWWPRTGRLGKLALLAGALLLGLGIYSTLTRSVWLGAALGLAVFLGLTLPRSWRLPALGALGLAGVLVAAMHWEHLVAFKRDRDLSAVETAESVKLRPILAVVAWQMFLDRPLLGCGFAHYPDAKADYFSDRSSGLVLEKGRPFVQHNVFLSLLVETGLVGMGLFVALLGLWLRDAWRTWRSPSAPAWARQAALLLLAVLANYLVNGMFHEVALISMVNMLLCFAAGLAAAAKRAAEPERCLAATGRGPNATQERLAGIGLSS